MLRNHTLLKDGARAQGVVLDKHVTTRNSSGTNILAYTVQIRVKFDDSTMTEFQSEHLRAEAVGHLAAGDLVPVRYDPGDHSRVVLDTEALAGAQAAHRS
jgi:hypothetical protein